MKIQLCIGAVLFISAFQIFSSPCQAANLPPHFASTPPSSGMVGQTFFYDGNASDPDGDVITYYMVFRIDDMSIDPQSGIFTWNPVKAGLQNITIYATDTITTATAQTFSVNITPRNNTPPIITSKEITTAWTGELYNYDVNATDADGDKVFYFLDKSPKGMTIDQSTGLVSWLPGDEFANKTEYVLVVVKDSPGQSTPQPYMLTIKKREVAENHLPSIVGTPVTTATAGEPYYYDVNATDIDGDRLTFGIQMGPANLQINNQTGEISWTPALSQVGPQSIRIFITDSRANVTFNFSINVKEKGSSGHNVTEDPAGRVTVAPEMVCVFSFAIALLVHIGFFAAATLRKPSKPPAARPSRPAPPAAQMIARPQARPAQRPPYRQ